MRKVLIACLAAAMVAAAPAAGWEEPARGTKTRKALMDAVRPHVEWSLGARVEFVVGKLRRSGDVAYAELTAQRDEHGQPRRKQVFPNRR
jgi:hypothetical protein